MCRSHSENGTEIALPGARQPALLAALVVRAGHVVSVDRLVDLLWEQPPENPTAALHSAVFKLRASLAKAGGREMLLTREPGYRPGPAAGRARCRGLRVARAAGARRAGGRGGGHPGRGASPLARPAVRRLRRLGAGEVGGTPARRDAPGRRRAVRSGAPRVGSCGRRRHADAAVRRRARTPRQGADRPDPGAARGRTHRGGPRPVPGAPADARRRARAGAVGGARGRTAGGAQGTGTRQAPPRRSPEPAAPGPGRDAGEVPAHRGGSHPRLRLGRQGSEGRRDPRLDLQPRRDRVRSGPTLLAARPAHRRPVTDRVRPRGVRAVAGPGG